MASQADPSPSIGPPRPALIYAGGIVIILCSIGALLLPALDRLSGPTMIGGLLLAAGIVEALAGSLRGEVKGYAMAAGGVTAIAGLLFLLSPDVRFSPSVTLIIAWLLVRSVILIVASRHSAPSVRLWMMISSGMDFFLALLLFFGLSISALVVSIFGPTQYVVASFSWVLAASFVVTGSLLLEVASCHRAIR